MTQHYTRETLEANIRACTKCGGRGQTIHERPSNGVTYEVAKECLCLKRLQLFETVGQAIFNARPPVYDERLRPDARLVIHEPWQWLMPRVLGTCATHWDTRIQVITDLDLRDSTFRDRIDESLPTVKELMSTEKLLILRLGVARKTEGLDGIVAEALSRRETGPLWCCLPNDYHSATKRLYAALDGLQRIKEATNGPA